MEWILGTTQVYKPGSVLTAIYLALQLLAGSSRLLEAVGQTYCFSTALLRDRVYIVKPMLPWAGWALTPPFHPYLVGSRISTFTLLQAVKITRYTEPPFSHQTRLRWALMGALYGIGGISLLHLSWGHPRQALPVILALWSPDFPHLDTFVFHPRLSDLVAQTF